MRSQSYESSVTSTQKLAKMLRDPGLQQGRTRGLDRRAVSRAHHFVEGVPDNGVSRVVKQDFGLEIGICDEASRRSTEQRLVSAFYSLGICAHRKDRREQR